MVTNKAYHFVMDWRNSADLRQLLEDLYLEGNSFIDVSFYPPYREAYTDQETGKEGYHTEPARLTFDMHTQLDSGAWKLSESLSYEETKEDRATGIAYPSGLFNKEA